MNCYHCRYHYYYLSFSRLSCHPLSSCLSLYRHWLLHGACLELTTAKECTWQYDLPEYLDHRKHEQHHKLLRLQQHLLRPCCDLGVLQCYGGAYLEGEWKSQIRKRTHIFEHLVLNQHNFSRDEDCGSRPLGVLSRLPLRVAPAD